MATYYRWVLMLIPFLFISVSCKKTTEEKQQALYQNYCASCHMLPSLDALPRHLWEQEVLPDMAARLGIRDSTNDPYKNLSLVEQGALLKANVYPSDPLLPMEDWEMLKEYIIENAPQKLPAIKKRELKELTQFSVKNIAIDSINGSTISYLRYDSIDGKIFTGTMRGKLSKYNPRKDSLELVLRAGSTITHFSQNLDTTYLTTIGFLLPSEIPAGDLGIKQGNKIRSLPQKLHRPVHTLIHDFNSDGKDEILISEFGDLKGQLSLWKKNGQGHFTESILLQQPGVIRTIAKDLNKDGKDDIVVLTSQGEEGITIFHQSKDLTFKSEQVLRFPPNYGSSWFELVDFDNDGDLDILTVHGDNADKTYTAKPYHGMRVHLNNGQNQFIESFFYPMNGCTRIIAKDFDADNDLDIALLSTFPDYKAHPDESFIYLETKDAKNFKFEAYKLPEPNDGRWFLMDVGDIDKDGDEDLMISSLTYAYSPIPESLENKWKNENIDLIILENNLLKKEDEN